MKILILSLCLLMSASLFIGCASRDNPNEQTGTVVGGALGGLLGSQVGQGRGRTAATIIGAIMGASIGSSIGRTMDETDRWKVARSLETAKTGSTNAWKNPDTQASYSVTPTRTYARDSGPCREYTLKAYIGGVKEQVYGTACRRADGDWQVVP
jgi:surface antigen